jgi:GTP cyclohydrolase I
VNPEALRAISVEDVQGGHDHREVAIDQVGIDELAYPVTVVGRDGEHQRTVARATITVALAQHRRGVHMSRLVEALHAHAEEISPQAIRRMTGEVRERLESDFARVELRFPYFLKRTAPVSELESLMHYECVVVAESGEGVVANLVGVRVPITSLCPCSKEISDYGAHNQRGYVELEATSPWSAGDAAGLWFEDLIEVAEAAGSAPIYPLLKRSDERELTMRAYDNPAFVEDVVRNVAVELRADLRVASFRVRASNHESIHDHSAVAQLRWERRTAE